MDTAYKVSSDGDVYSIKVVKQIKNKIIWNDVSRHYNFSHYNVSKKTTRSDKEIKKVCKLLSKGVSVKKCFERNRNSKTRNTYNI